ncbi:MAG: hypothetical protein NC191_07290 [Muribaculaceae bacterium]|nr:hypothetical protein [Muribaculaceae bacterium]
MQCNSIDNTQNLSFGAKMRARDVRKLEKIFKKAISNAKSADEVDFYRAEAENFGNFLRDIDTESNTATIYTKVTDFYGYQSRDLWAKSKAEPKRKSLIARISWDFWHTPSLKDPSVWECFFTPIKAAQIKAFERAAERSGESKRSSLLGLKNLFRKNK